MPKFERRYHAHPEIKKAELIEGFKLRLGFSEHAAFVEALTVKQK